MEIIEALRPIVTSAMDFLLIALPALFCVLAIKGMIWGKPYENDNDPAAALIFGLITVFMICMACS